MIRDLTAAALTGMASVLGVVLRLVVVAPLIAALGLGGLAWYYHQRAAALATDLAAARAQLAQRAEADAVHRAYITRLEEERARWGNLTRDLQSMEGRDAPLSDHLGRAARRLWP
ncbi:hypothetical protein ORIO_02250 [Cereibacter azotoformans]|uniref:Uncharacterized protein n=1 Tax=Cereibacter sphaeroides (strain ATCC 17025 / ATH 2.4.3) TaxID=349102 RepID=A4WPP2_CERS5|nr:hypothetical protein [Cereibacter azotoformans]ULB08758.1 hypothetical protein ORIO_02250 [Cereibacter azotoformans]